MEKDMNQKIIGSKEYSYYNCIMRGVIPPLAYDAWYCLGNKTYSGIVFT